MKTPLIKLAGLAIVLLAPVAGATERIVWGEVTHVRPINETQRIEPARACAAKPPAAAGLASLLAWDLQPGCAFREASRTTAYEVKYRWDGRTYSLTMDKHPGNRIPLLLKLR